MRSIHYSQESHPSSNWMQTKLAMYIRTYKVQGLKSMQKLFMLQICIKDDI